RQRLHGRTDVAFLTAADLVFTRSEARSLVKRFAGIPPGEEALDALMATTEGWAVALEVAAVGLRTAPDPEAYIETLRGDDRHIAAFLDEVLAQPSAPVRRFLAETSILDRLNGSLCASVTGGDARRPM